MKNISIEQEGNSTMHHFGMKVVSYFKITGGKNDGRYVKVFTSKGLSGWVSTNAQVMTLGTSNGFSTESFMMFQDPSLCLNKGEKVRVTEKTLMQQHQRALNDLVQMSTEWIDGKC